MREVDYRLAWSRTYLKKYGLLENSSRAVWALLKADIDITSLDLSQIKRVVRGQNRSTEQQPENDQANQVEKEIIAEVNSTDRAFS